MGGSALAPARITDTMYECYKNGEDIELLALVGPMKADIVEEPGHLDLSMTRNALEALRAFDIIFALKKPPGTQVLGILVRDNLVGEGGGHVGLGSSYGVILLVLCLGFIIWYLVNNYRENEA